ncbi:anthranilate synthase component I family protein [Cohnella hashimotonis]|uniref:Anthranilate synthase component I family protein n=1 Tax=Cohnella hashimotonis TaxID=2826895 RepID=A0ABT6TR79_9BACL|nr:anthranilate synthase component I family protein [Cohnella hashimotonis]MDI4649350.1 anthranilate synthase component I family protein [Cohnella hashimotonis]
MEARISLEKWRSWIEELTDADAAAGRGYNRLPYIEKHALAAGEDRVPLWRGAWEAAGEEAFVLESGKGGRYTFLGIRPSAVLVGRGDQAELRRRGGEGAREEAERLSGDPISVVREVMGRYRTPSDTGLPMFTGGTVGYWSYDVARALERLPQTAADELGLPDYAFLLIDELWIVDHEAGELYLAVHADPGDAKSEPAVAAAYARARAHAARMKADWDGFVAASAAPEAASALVSARGMLAEEGLALDVETFAKGLRTSFSKEAFEQAVRRIQQYIGQGDVFQVNLSLRQTMPVTASPEALYEWLRLINPSPYMGLLRLPGFSLVSASPELLVKRQGERVSMRPIAGTRRRGRTPEEDAAMADELLSSVKERAEHIMLVDLARNDLGRISAYGSVHVPELLTIERYSHVMHLVSQVEGRIAPGKDSLDVLAASFPGGTITGAPKIRTMEIIEELEPVRRGAYTGSIGWIDYAGNMEFNIIIRTMVAKDGLIHIQAGAGIVIDSDPEREFYECLNKAKALWKAVQYGERLSPDGTGADAKGDWT